MPNWIVGLFNLIVRTFKQAGISLYRKIRVRKAKNITENERDICERYGEQVIGMVLAGGYTPSTKDLQGLYQTEESRQHARDWLTERADYHERHDRWTSLRDFLLEIVVIFMIGWEIHLGIKADREQNENFEKQQQVLSNLRDSSKSTADTLAALKQTTEAMRDMSGEELGEMKKSATQSEKSAKTAVESKEIAAKSLEVSQRAYVSGIFELAGPPKAGEKLHVKAVLENTGLTPALEVTSLIRMPILPIAQTLDSVHELAYGTVFSGTRSTTTLGHGQTFQQSIESITEPSELDVTEINEGRIRVYVFVLSTYRDSFDYPHKVELCVYYDPKFKQLMNCDKYNTAN
jgi:hypothetical protein